jgi:hypothetical protein
MSDELNRGEGGDGSRGEEAEPSTLEEAQEQLRVLRKELTAVRKESARRRQALKERDGQEADAGSWKAVAVASVVEAEAARAGARRPELLGRLVDVSAIEGDTLDEIREGVREEIRQALAAAPELLGEPPAVGARAPGVQDRRRPQPPADSSGWLRKAARSG